MHISLVGVVYDTFNHMTIDLDADNKVQLWKIQEKTMLIVVIDKNVSSDIYTENIEEALEMIEQGHLKLIQLFLDIDK